MAPSGSTLAPPPTVLAIDLPPGVGVWVDGKDRGVTPIASMEVSPGGHQVRLQTACGDIDLAEVEVLAETTTTIDATKVPQLGFAALRVRARTHLGETVENLRVQANESTIPSPQAGAAWVMPACKLRVRVSAAGRDDLGGVIEDIAFVAGSTVKRAVVLAPGPDMVRIPAGEFMFGPTEAAREDFKRNPEKYLGDSAGDPALTWESFRAHFNARVQVSAFELDKTEVTTAQYMACRRAAKRAWCRDPRDCREVGGCPQTPGHFGVNAAEDEKLCTISSDPRERTYLEADANRPASCVERWQAEQYCNWAGKRLPTEVEWEYAARSRRSDYSQPWGTERDAQCQRSNCTPDGTPWSAGERQPSVVCSYPEGNSVDGLCDMMGNVAEHVEPSKLPGRMKPEENDKPGRGRGSQPRDAVGEVFDLRRMRGRPDDGFRCARDMSGSAP
jgi:formylglycine-generating enzyme required for sulfatase activity